MNSARATTVPLQWLAWSPFRFDRELFFVFLDDVIVGFSSFSHLPQPSCSSSPAALLPTALAPPSSTATAGALLFNIQTWFPLVLSRTLGVSLSSLNELLDPHQGVTTESRLCHAVHKSLCRPPTKLFSRSALRWARRFFFPCWCRCACVC